MAIIYAMYKRDPRISPVVGEMFFQNSRPHRDYYRQVAYDVASVQDDGTLVADRLVLQGDYPYFRKDDSVIKITRNMHLPSPHYLAVRILGGPECIFDRTVPSHINFIGGKARTWPSEAPNKMHVLSVSTDRLHSTRYLCSKAFIGEYIEIAHKDPVLLSEIQRFSHLITCGNCTRMLRKWSR